MLCIYKYIHTLTMALAAIRNWVAFSLTALILAESSGDMVSRDSSSFRARCSIVPLFVRRSFSFCSVSSRSVRSLIVVTLSPFWLSLSWYSSSSSSGTDVQCVNEELRIRSILSALIFELEFLHMYVYVYTVKAITEIKDDLDQLHLRIIEIFFVTNLIC